MADSLSDSLSNPEEAPPCGPTFTQSVRDYSAGAGGARTYLEQTGLIQTLRLPSPLLETSRLRPHSIPLQPPLPLPALLITPGREGRTLEWIDRNQESGG